jgi:hypothetical protein
MEIYRQHRGAQDKHTYFLLAAVGACIGFAATQTKDLPLRADQWPLAIAVFMWGMSFWCGCSHVRSMETVMLANMRLLTLQNGRDPMVGADLQGVFIGVQKLREVIDRHNKSAGRTHRWQFRFLAVGVAAYLAWHVLAMSSRA